MTQSCAYIESNSKQNVPASLHHKPTGVCLCHCIHHHFLAPGNHRAVYPVCMLGKRTPRNTLPKLITRVFVVYGRSYFRALLLREGMTKITLEGPWKCKGITRPLCTLHHAPYNHLNKHAAVSVPWLVDARLLIVEQVPFRLDRNRCEHIAQR
jgi:hypothetical protein